MKETARELLNLPVRRGEKGELNALTDAQSENMTAEEAVIVKQIQQAIKGSTEAAMFLQCAASEDNAEADDSTAIAEAAQKGDTLEMLKALRDKLSKIIDRTTSPREIASVTRQLMEVNDRIERIEKAKERREGENPLNIIRFNRAEKQARKVAGS